jgi:hypothetical protein
VVRFQVTSSRPLRGPPGHLSNRHNKLFLCRSEVTTTVVMKSSIFRNIRSCSPLKVNRRFGRTHRLHLQGRKISQARKKRERWEAEQSACRHFGLYRKQEGNGRQQQVSSRWLARRLSDTMERTNRRQEQDN